MTGGEAVGWDGALVQRGGGSRGYPSCVYLARVMPQLKAAASTLQLRKKKTNPKLMRLNYCVIVIQRLKPKFHNRLVISAFKFFVSIMQAAHLVIMKY